MATDNNKEAVEALRKKFMDNPPEGYSKSEIGRMRDNDLLDMAYFLNEESFDMDDWD